MAARPARCWPFPPRQRAGGRKALLAEIGKQKASRTRGKSKGRSTKSKPRPKFNPKPVGTKVAAVPLITEVEVLRAEVVLC